MSNRPQQIVKETNVLTGKNFGELYMVNSEKIVDYYKNKKQRK